MHADNRGRRAAAFAALFVTLLTLLPYDAAFAQRRAIEPQHFASIPAPPFKTSLYIPAAHNGLRGDGRTDNTRAFRALLGTGNRTIQIAKGTYITGKLVIPRNTVLLLDPGVVIKDSGKLGPNDRLISILDGNVYIRGSGAKVLSDRGYYSGGEQRHGVFIFGASHVFIDGLESSNNSGDGFYIGGPAGRPAQDIRLENCSAKDNRRQGLSITSARRLLVTDCLFADTKGTAPQFGVDLEPNGPGGVLDDIRIVRPKTVRNYGGGIQIYLGAYFRNASHPAIEPVNIQILGHQSVGERKPYVTFGTNRVKGSLHYIPARSHLSVPQGDFQRYRAVPHDRHQGRSPTQ